MNERAPFYVGYLPLPPELRSAVVGFAGAMVLGMVSLAALLASRQQDPGSGVRHGATKFAIEGVLDEAPYPMLHVEDSASVRGVRSVLLAAPFKFGVRERVDGLDGQRVRLRGHFIARDGRSMFEIEDGDGAIQPLGGAATLPTPELLGNHRLVGEIADSKCFLGMMKPGVGKTHRACAVRCISGGIPPVFVTRAPDGSVSMMLLTDADGGAIDAPLLPFVAEPVELRGALSRLGDLLVLAVDPGDIRRR